MAPREAWTDERLDDLSNRVDVGFYEVKEEQRALRREMGELRRDVKQDIDKLSGRFDALIITLLATFAGILVTHFIG